jgi:hypothetical protein
MFALRDIEDRTVGMLRHALLVGMALLLIVEIGSTSAFAGWPSFRKEKTDNVDPLPKYSPDFESSIRKLLQKSKEQLDKGDIEAAIELAEHAARISESSSKLTKLSAEVSPEATSQYVRELRRKKSAMTARRTGGTSPSTKTASAKQPAVDNQQSPQNPAKTLPETSPKPKNVAPATVASVNIKSKHVLEVEDVQVPSTLGKSESIELPVVVTKAPEIPPPEVEYVLPIVAPTRTEHIADRSKETEDPFDTPPIGDVIVSAQKRIPGSAEPLVLEDDSNTLWNDNPPQIIPQSPIPTKTSVARQKAIEQSTQIKLYPRHNSDYVAETARTETLDEANPVIVEGPKIVPQNNAPMPQVREVPRTLQEEPDQNSGRSQVATNSLDLKNSTGTDEMEDPFATDEVADAALVVSFMESEGDDNDRTSKSTQDASHDFSNVQFSPENVLELKRRLDSVSALNPGEVRSSASEDRLNETFCDSNDVAPKFVKVRKRRAVDRELPPVESADVTASPVRTTVIGTTSMIKWRSAKDQTASSKSANTTISKAEAIPADLRGSNPGTTVSTSRVPLESSDNSDLEQFFAVGTNRNHPIAPTVSDRTETRSALPQLQGSPWDNASAPPIEHTSEIGIKSSVPKISEFDFSDLAPSPPSDSSVEQAAFDSPGELFERHRRSRPDQGISSTDSQAHLDLPLQTLSVSSDSETDETDETEEDIVSDASTSDIDADEIKQESLMDRPAGRLAVILGIPKSTASSILGMTGIAVVITGLWIVRSIVRAKTL